MNSFTPHESGIAGKQELLSMHNEVGYHVTEDLPLKQAVLSVLVGKLARQYAVKQD